MFGHGVGEEWPRRRGRDTAKEGCSGTGSNPQRTEQKRGIVGRRFQIVATQVFVFKVYKVLQTDGLGQAEQGGSWEFLAGGADPPICAASGMPALTP